MCVGFNAVYTPEFLEYFLSGPLGRCNRALLEIFFSRIRLCRIVLYPIENEVAGSRVDVCDCRLLARRCDARLDLCYKVGEQEGDEGIPGSELIERSERAARQGLVRMRVQTARTKTEYCHCCACCCQVLVVTRRLGREMLTTSGAIPSTLLACIRCGKCVDACPMGARRLGGWDGHTCIGCGVCAATCDRSAIVMEPESEERPPSLERKPFPPLVARAVATTMMLYVMLLHRCYSRKAGCNHT